MSSPDGTGPGPPDVNAQQQGKRKRPDLDKAHGSSRHGSSFLGKLHRKHDAKHHAEHAPLLANPEQEDTPEPEDHPGHPHHHVRYFFGRIFGRVEEAAEPVKDHFRAAGRLSRRTTLQARHHVKKNPKSYMCAIILMLLATIIGLAIAYALLSKKDDKPSYCSTPSCVEAADTILKNMDPDVAEYVSTQDTFGIKSYPVDPCEKFDQFVCGGFEQQHQFRSDQNEISTVTLMADEVDAILKQILEKPKSGIAHADKHIFKLAKDDYKSCMDERANEDAGLHPLKRIIDHVKADLPIDKGAGPGPDYRLQFSTAAKDKRGDFLTEIMVDNVLLNAPALLAFRIGADDRSPDHQVVFASPVHAIGLPSPDFYPASESDILVDYRKVVNESLSLFYKTPTNATATWHLGLKSQASSAGLSDRVVNFEIRLANIVPSPEQEQDITNAFNKIRLKDFNKMLPQVDMRHLFEGVAHATPAPKTMILSSPEYLQKLSSLLQETNKMTLQGFFVWKVIQAWAYRVDAPGLSTLKAFNANVRGTKTDQPEERWRQCVRSVNHDLGWITSRFYVNTDFDLSLKKTAGQMIDGIRVVFTKILIASSWMSQDDRQVAATKARSIQANLGYPTTKPDVKDAISVEDYYDFDNLKIAKDAYLENGVHATKQQVRRQWTKAAGSPTDKDEWEMFSTTVNAYYKPTVNKMFVPAAMLQPPVLYDPSLPSYVSYGSFGAIAGHEISHAFDPIGSHYDADGSYDDWWSHETAERFEHKAQCFVDQYSSYKVSGPNGDVNVNGNLTLAEAVADAGGAHAAFHAWKEYEQKMGSKYLPGLKKFTKEQVFWLSYGNFWCSKMTPKRTLEVVLTDPHGPKSIRILGTVANSKAFREAWSCPAKEHTCHLW